MVSDIMAQIKYMGFGHRSLNAADLKKAGVEEGFSKTLFVGGVATEVDDSVAKAILDNAGLFGKFEAVTGDDSANQLDIPTSTASESETTATAPAKAARKQ
jgi:hypothetical protein